MTISVKSGNGKLIGTVFGDKVTSKRESLSLLDHRGALALSDLLIVRQGTFTVVEIFFREQQMSLTDTDLVALLQNRRVG